MKTKCGDPLGTPIMKEWSLLRNILCGLCR